MSKTKAIILSGLIFISIIVLIIILPTNVFFILTSIITGNWLGDKVYKFYKWLRSK